MAKARELLKRAKTIKSIRSVTRAMELVASTRFHRAHEWAASARPYTDRLFEMVGDLVARSRPGELDHPLLRQDSKTRRDVLMILGSGRGLCGPYNMKVMQVGLERLGQLLAGDYAVELHVSGAAAIEYLRYRGIAIDREYREFGYLPAFGPIGRLGDSIMRRFLDGQISGLEVAYTQYLPGGQPRCVIAQLLPLHHAAPEPDRWALGEPAPYEFLPDRGQILQRLLPATVRLRLYQCFLDAGLTEQLSRIQAMRSARENADEMIRDLTVRYNRTRQAQVTTELAEIMGGSVSME